MSTISDAIRAHHRELATMLSGYVRALEEETTGEQAGELARFLRSDLLPHARGEDAHLYPVMDTLIAAHGSPTATMKVDHEWIERYISQIAEYARTLQLGTPAEQANAREHLLRSAQQLEAILEMHTEKEERVYLPLFDAHLPLAEQQRVLDDMHGEASEAVSTASPKLDELDVRPLPPAQRHALIFSKFEALQPGDAFMLVNDHDPKPLYYQLNFEYRGALVWDYIEQGPDVWRVSVGKGANTGAN